MIIFDVLLFLLLAWSLSSLTEVICWYFEIQVRPVSILATYQVLPNSFMAPFLIPLHYFSTLMGGYPTGCSSCFLAMFIVIDDWIFVLCSIPSMYGYCFGLYELLSTYTIWLPISRCSLGWVRQKTLQPKFWVIWRVRSSTVSSPISSTSQSM